MKVRETVIGASIGLLVSGLILSCYCKAQSGDGSAPYMLDESDTNISFFVDSSDIIMMAEYQPCNSVTFTDSNQVQFLVISWSNAILDVQIPENYPMTKAADGFFSFLEPYINAKYELVERKQSQ